MLKSILRQLGLGNLLGFGAARLWRGFREGDQTIIAVGAAALLLAWFRRPRDRVLLHSERVERGERVVVDMRPANETAG